MTERQMTQVIVYENGEVKIKQLGKSYHAVQTFSEYGDENGKGNGVYCLKGDEKKYVKILAQTFFDDIDTKIESLQTERKRLEKKLSKLIKEGLK